MGFTTYCQIIQGKCCERIQAAKSPKKKLLDDEQAKNEVSF